MTNLAPEATCFTAGIIKGLNEQGDPYAHFGSLLAFQCHFENAIALGLVDRDFSVTQEGHTYYRAKNLDDLAPGRAYMWGKPEKYWEWPETGSES